MKMSLFNSAEQFADYSYKQAELIENNGLRIAKELYYKALEGEGKNDFLRTNNIPIDTDAAQRVWEQHIEWLEGDINYLEKKVRKYRRDADRALQSIQ